MSRDKQIEEMAKYCPHYYKEECYYVGESDTECDMLCQYGTYAEHLYNAGYRKASEVARDIFNDLNEMWHKGRGFIKYEDLVRLERLHEQKYTEDGK